MPLACALLLATAPAPVPGPEATALAAAVLAAPAREGAGDKLLREAKQLRYAQRWFEAAAVYRRFLATQPGHARTAEARFWLAATLESDQRWDEAADAYGDFLERHPDQRLLGKEAQLNRIRCWGVRQGQNPAATPGLLEALKEPTLEVQVAAALQLAKTGDRRAVDGLRRGLGLPASADACSLALINLGEKPGPAPASQARFLVIRIKEGGKPDTVTIRLTLTLARALGNYLSDAQLRQARAKGVDLEAITEQAGSLPKGSVLLSVDDGKSNVQVTVE